MFRTFVEGWKSIHVIIVKIWEGLGNQLFQYAFAKSLQMESNEKVYLDFCSFGRDGGCEKPELFRNQGITQFRISLDEYKRVNDYYFFLNGNNRINRSIKYLSEHACFPYKYFQEDTVAFKPELLCIKGNYYVHGWFQNEKYFKKYEEIIRKEFKLKQKIKIGKELKEVLACPDTVSIHIRRGDFKKGANVLDLKYYERAVEYISHVIENPLLCIFSDEVEWVKSNMNFKGRCYYINENRALRDYEELIVMSHCKHNIIANSTFSWWGAWLNNNYNKIVIGPRKWFLDNRVRNVGINIMPDNWIKI